MFPTSQRAGIYVGHLTSTYSYAPCEAYIACLARAPNFLNLGNISDLFGGTILLSISLTKSSQCPSKAQSENGIQLLITYVWRPDDDLLKVAAKLNASARDIVLENYQNFSDAVNHPVLILSCQFSLNNILILNIKNPSICGSLLSFFEPKTIQDKLLPGISGYLSKPVIFEVKEIIGGSTYRANINGRLLTAKKTKGDITEELMILQKMREWVSGQVVAPQVCIILKLCSLLNLDSKAAESTRCGDCLHYMHEQIQPSIVHRDIHVQIPKVDAFAFGVVLLELFSGKEGHGDRGKCKGMHSGRSCLYSARLCMAELVFNLTVLTQTSSEILARSSTAGLEAEEIPHIMNPVIAR
ncbi:hypothetical protein Tsubulata_039422 [Turnera subulata]|uniref:NFP third LysM domain-containing protein n=1 Tax=Turnera subulata TaxID=218843 RepID=A0A9Q0JIL8_9ROSI|nr:hypothetical protein Tsubulata_039422 [Turnera subulata]